MQPIRKWSICPRGNGTLNIIETDLVGIDRVILNLRSLTKNEAQAISVARESLALLKGFVEHIDDFSTFSVGRAIDIGNFTKAAQEIINQSEQ